MKYLKTFEFFAFKPEKGKKWTPENWHGTIGTTFTHQVEHQFKDKGYEDDDFNNIVGILEEDCKEFLIELRSCEDIDLLFRGCRNVDDVDNGIWQSQSESDRFPKDTSKDISNIFDKYFKEKFGVELRKVGTFASKSPDIASDYGTPYLFFPISKYKYYWNYYTEDLYSDIRDTEWYYKSEDDLEKTWNVLYGENTNGEWVYNDVGYGNDIISASNKARLNNTELKNTSIPKIQSLLYWEPEVELEDFVYNTKEDGKDAIKDIVSKYQEGGLQDIDLQEITFVCDRYYLVDIAFYNKLMEYLK